MGVACEIREAESISNKQSFGHQSRTADKCALLCLIKGEVLELEAGILIYIYFKNVFLQGVSMVLQELLTSFDVGVLTLMTMEKIATIVQQV